MIAFNSITTCVIKDDVQVFSIDEEWDIDLENPLVNWVACEQVDLYESFSNVDFYNVQFSIYPNPTTHLLHIESEEASIESLEIFNLDGKRVLQTDYNQNQPIVVEHLSKGLYLLKIQTAKGSLTKKFVKK